MKTEALVGPGHQAPEGAGPQGQADWELGSLLGWEGQDRRSHPVARGQL